MTKTKQKEIRLKILSIMGSSQDWLKDENKVETIQNLASQLTTDTENLPSLGNWENFRRSDFLYWISEGYNSVQIAKAYGVAKATFLKWKQNQGFCKKTKLDILNEFADEIYEIRKKNKKMNNSKEML